MDQRVKIAEDDQGLYLPCGKADCEGVVRLGPDAAGSTVQCDTCGSHHHIV